jgi:hypothetical protein
MIVVDYLCFATFRPAIVSVHQRLKPLFSGDCFGIAEAVALSKALCAIAHLSGDEAVAKMGTRFWRCGQMCATRPYFPRLRSETWGTRHSVLGIRQMWATRPTQPHFVLLSRSKGMLNRKI